MATNQELFESKLDALADSINAKAGTSGKKTIDEMIETVGSIALPTITIEEIEGGHRVIITDHTGTRSFDVMDGTPGESAPYYILNWYAEPTEAQKQANLAVMSAVSALDLGSYSLFIKNGSYVFPALYVSGTSRPSFIGLSLQDGASLTAYQFAGNSLSNYQQLSWNYIEQTTFDDSSQNAAAMSVIATYIDTQIEANAILSSEKGVAGGVPTLDATGKVPKGQLPPTVPDGGTAGQVLTKQSNADGDADWENIPTVAPITGTLTLLANSWVETQSGSGVYKQSITIPSSNTNSKVDIVPSSVVIDQMLADGVKSLYVENNSGTLYAVAVGAEPSVDMTVQYQMVIVVSAETIGAVNLNDVYQITGDILILDGGTSTSNASNLYQDANGQSF